MAEEKQLPKEEKHEMLSEDKLKALAESQELKIRELETLLRRVQADFENYKKYVEKDKLELATRYSAAVVQKLLPTLDELEIALGHIHEGGKDSKEMHRGMELLYVNLLKTLKDEGVREIEALGQKLDPFLHEAIRYEEGEIEDGKISEVLKKGYVFRNHVIRHALVVVSSGKKKGENK